MTVHQKIFTLIATLAAISLVFIVALAPRVAHASEAYPPGCGKTKEIFKELSEKFKEMPVGAGLNGGNELVSVFVSETGTFTVVVTSPQGTSCIRSSGTDWVGKTLKFGRES